MWAHFVFYQRLVGIPPRQRLVSDALAVLAFSQFSIEPQAYETFGDLNAQRETLMHAAGTLQRANGPDQPSLDKTRTRYRMPWETRH